MGEARDVVASAMQKTLARPARYRQADAVLSALREAGFAVVPTDPNWQMQIAGRDAMQDEDFNLSTDDARDCYRAMLTASQNQ